MAIRFAEDRDAIRRFVKGPTTYDYAITSATSNRPVFDTHPMATVTRRDIARARSHKLSWSPRTTDRGRA